MDHSTVALRLETRTVLLIDELNNLTDLKLKGCSAIVLALNVLEFHGCDFV